MNNSSETATDIYKLALQSAPSGFLVVDVGGTIQYANQTLADMFGHALEDLLGESIEILLPDPFVASHREHVRNYAKNPAPRAMGSGRDLEGISKDRRRFPVEVGLRPVHTENGPVVVATIIDISKRKAMEDRLRQHEEELERLVAERTQELERAQQDKERMLDQLIQAEKMATIGTLVSGIGHEINNPLYVLQATAEALCAESDLNQCHAFGGSILRQTARIAETVKNLSRYAQPGSKQELECVNFDDVIADALDLARQSVRDDQVEFLVNIEPTPGFLARFEEIVQVAFNLLRNAIQAIPDKGRIYISSARQGDWVSLQIRDNGKGIPEEILSRIFDPFFTTKGPDEGEGLGLYIVHQIVTRCGGSIDAENADSGGARFEIRFPVAGQGSNQEESS
jgi:PAS domain S-box-containing protein